MTGYVFILAGPVGDQFCNQPRFINNQGGVYGSHRSSQGSYMVKTFVGRSRSEARAFEGEA